jgi:hypothetical protein
LSHAREIDLPGHELGVVGGDGRRLAEPDSQCRPPSRSAVNIEDDVPRDAEQPGPRVRQARRYVVSPPPGDQERLGNDVLGLLVGYPSLREPDQVGVRRLEQPGEPCLSPRR